MDIGGGVGSLLGGLGSSIGGFFGSVGASVVGAVNDAVAGVVGSVTNMSPPTIVVGAVAVVGVLALLRWVTR